jgi:hypothetical protein
MNAAADSPGAIVARRERGDLSAGRSANLVVTLLTKPLRYRRLNMNRIHGISVSGTCLDSMGQSGWSREIKSLRVKIARLNVGSG